MLALVGCTTTPQNYDLSNIHFPRVKASTNDIVIPGSFTFKIELIDNCIYGSRNEKKLVIVWPSEAKLITKQDKIFIIADGSQQSLKDYTNKIQIGKKADLDGTLMGSNYVYNSSIYEAMTQQECRNDGALEVRNWKPS